LRSCRHRNSLPQACLFSLMASIAVQRLQATALFRNIVHYLATATTSQTDGSAPQRHLASMR
jgi:hypothetical protein